jgi:hypothetical protein
MNRFFVSFAAICTPAVFAYAYLSEWIGIKFLEKKVVLRPDEQITYPYYHNSEEVYLTVMLLFGLLFVGLFCSAVYFTLKQKRKLIFSSFLLSLLGILAIMINGAIK